MRSTCMHAKRGRGLPLAAAVLIGCAALASPGSARAGERPFAEENLWASARRLALELSLLRLERGLPPLRWCERMALPMRLHLDALLEAGYRGVGTPPASVGRCAERATENHRWRGGQVYANFGLADPETYEPREQIERMLESRKIKSYTDPEQNAVACVLRPLSDHRVFVYLAVAKADPEAIGKELDAVARPAPWVFGGSRRDEKTALGLLVARASPEGVPLFLALLADRDPSRRRTAVRALEKTRDPGVVPVLLDALEDRDPEVRAEAADALRRLTGKEDGPNAPGSWRDWWASARDGFRPPDLPEEAPPPPPGEGDGRGEEADGAEPPDEEKPAEAKPFPIRGSASRVARKALSASDPRARLFCARGLSLDGGGGSALAGLLSDASFPVRREAALGLERVSGKRLFPKLARALSGAGNDPLVLMPLYRALGRTGDRRAVRILDASAQENASVAVQASIAKGLGRIADKRAVDALLGLLKRAESSGSKGLSSAARRALLALTGAEAGSSAADWEAWWRENRRTFRFPD